MKKLTSLLIALFSLVWLTGAGWLPLAAPSVGGCSQATTLLARYTAAGGSLTGTESTAMTTMICGLVTDGVITGTMAGSGTGASACGSILDALYIFPVNNVTNAKLNLCSTSFSLTYHGTPPESSQFSADHGYTGDGSTVYLDTSYTPSTAAGNLTLNNASIGVYDLTNRAAASVVQIGAYDGSNALDIATFIAGGTSAQIVVNDATFGTTPSAVSQGFVVASRASSTTIVPYKNGSATTSVTATSVALTTKPVFLLAISSAGGTPANLASDQISAAFIGAALTSGQQTSLSNRINAYMTTFLINVY